LGFGPEFLGRVRLVTAISSLFGVWLYNQYLKTKPIKDILFWSSIVSAPLGMLNLLLISHVNREMGIPDSWFVAGDDVILSILGEIAFLPTLVLAARLCPPGVEAVLFAVRPAWSYSCSFLFFFFLICDAHGLSSVLVVTLFESGRLSCRSITGRVRWERRSVPY
jgi:hypothetical protein